MHIHAILHASFEKLGAIETWIHAKKYHLTKTHVYNGEALPALHNIDCVIFMGGPQSVCELDKYPYLKDEVEFAKQAIAQKKKVLGVCLGAQILSAALGAVCEKSPHKEIGVYPLKKTAAAAKDPLFQTWPAEFPAMHWHGDMAGLAPGMEILAESAGCPRQAFRYGDRVYGFQCHFELTPFLIEKMVAHCPEDLIPDTYVQNAETILASDFSPINQKMEEILEYLLHLK